MLEDIISPCKADFAEGVQTVLRGHENRSRRVVLLKGNLVQNSRNSSSGISARVTKGGRNGFSSIGSYTPEAARSVLAAATENALFLDARAKEPGITFPAQPSGLITPHRDIIDFEQKRFIDACREVDAYIEKTYPNLISRRIIYTEDSQDKIIVTSDAASGHVTYPRCYIYVMLTAESKAGVPVELFRAFGGAGSFEDNFSNLESMYPEIDNLYGKLMDKAEGVYAEAGTKTVILGGMMGGMLAHEAVGHTVEADLVIGGSVAGPNLGKRVASDLVSLVDYAHTAFGEEAPLPVFLDDEGVIARDVTLIENGILKGYMNNRDTAERFGMEACGNARAWEFTDEPLIRMRNTAVLPGTSTLEEMIASIDDGYYLIDSGNGQADLTGEFMFGVTLGYEIKKGKLGRALLDTTVSGIAFEMLKSVDMVSNNITWSSSGFCGKKQPMPVGMAGPEMRCKITIGGR
ncbi:MAG: TldD/PmbA family protein [Coriobacteriales bacterium]|nr:TldD/PmbA family protein [Coriobacteriales bacterium]